MHKDQDLMLAMETFAPILRSISGVLAVFVSQDETKGTTVLVAIDWSNFTYGSAAAAAIYSTYFGELDPAVNFNLRLKPVLMDDLKRMLALDESWLPLFPR